MGPGRNRSAEEMAEEIINQPGEGLDDMDDLLDGTELDEDVKIDNSDSDYDESDDGGDVIDW